MKTTDNKKDDSNRKSNEKVLVILFLYLLPAFFILLFSLTFLEDAPTHGHGWIELGSIKIINLEAIKEHYAALIGLPMAAIFSLWVVVMLKNKSGPIEFKILGLEFKGASGQVILWILCFITIVFAIKFVW